MVQLAQNRKASYMSLPAVLTTKTREWWPMLTVETEVNGDSKRTNERGSSLFGSWACGAGTRDFCSALAALVGPVKLFFSSRTILIPLCPPPSKLGRQSCWVACLLVFVSGSNSSSFCE